MPTDFLHGVEVVTVAGGPRPIQTIRSAIIGLIGTAPDASDAAFPLNTPVLVNSRGGYAGIGASGTLGPALDDIFTQFGAFVVVVRVEEGVDANATLANVIGGVDVGTGARLGIQAFRDSNTHTGVTPMLLIAPTFTSLRPTGVDSVTLTNVGAGYAAAPVITFTGGGADPAKQLPTAHAVMGTGANAGKLASIVIDSPGSHLTAAPAVVITGANTTPAVATTTTGTVKNPVAAALESIASGLRAHTIVSGPNTTEADALDYRADFGSRRVFIVDPYVKVSAAGVTVSRDAAANVAGLIARVDYEKGFWKSPSNEELFGVLGLDRPIDYALGDSNTRANLLNEHDVATIIRDNGFRLWGNRTTAVDGDSFQFLCVSRTADIIDMSIQTAHRWACDEGITRGYFDDVVSAVNSYLRDLQARGAILGGKCWVDPDLNGPTQIQNGHATFSYEFTPAYPAERVTFRSSITDAFLTSLFAAS